MHCYTIVLDYSQHPTQPIEVQTPYQKVSQPYEVQTSQQNIYEVSQNQFIAPKNELKAIYCPYCGEKIEENARFCSGCGAKIM